VTSLQMTAPVVSAARQIQPTSQVGWPDGGHDGGDQDHPGLGQAGGQLAWSNSKRYGLIV
jgi:hypothetical protein